MSSTCFETHGFIYREDSCKRSFDMVCLQSARLLTAVHVNIPYKNCIYICLPEDEPMRFETCRRRQKFKNKII